MLQITQNILMTKEEKERFENFNRKDAYEAIPEAKESSCLKLSGDKPVLNIVMKLYKTDEPNEFDELIDDRKFRQTLMAAFRATRNINFKRHKLISVSMIEDYAFEERSIVTNLLFICNDINNTVFRPNEIDEFKENVIENLYKFLKNKKNTIELKKEEKIANEQLQDDKKDENIPLINPQVEITEPTEIIEITEITENNKNIENDNIFDDLSWLDDFNDDNDIDIFEESKEIKNNDDIELNNNKNNISTIVEDNHVEDNNLVISESEPEKNQINEESITIIEEKTVNTLSEPKLGNIGSEHFIKDILQLNKENDIERQKKAYENADEIPFLNAISEYIPQTDIETLEHETPTVFIEMADAHVKTTSSKLKMQQAFERIMDYLMTNEYLKVRRAYAGEITREAFLDDVEETIKRNLKLPPEDIPILLKRVEVAFYSYYVLTPIISREDVSDIRVLAPNNINAKIHGKHYKVEGLNFLNVSDYERFISGLLVRNKINTDLPILVFTDREFNEDYILRFNICLADINSTETPYLHIRKVPKKKTTLKDLKNAGMLDDKIIMYLLDKVQTSRGLVFAGPSASGKTTLMNALLDYIPKDKSILCIQESEELFSDIHPNAYFQHIVKRRNETLIGLSELGQNGLLCDSGYFIIGECKGAEVRDLLRASNTGHKCWCSVHAQNSRETISRLADYVKYGADYSFKEAERMLKDLEVIVYIQDFKVTEISEIIGYDEDKQRILYKPIYRRNL